MTTIASDVPFALPLDLSVQLAGRELDDLIAQLEPTLSSAQVSLLHQIRLAAESLGAARAALVGRLRG